ncbi:MAG: BspA family leucine-rich repeat surface protein [Bacteroidales bacterium]|nr:BspA family leucine-rich repeat surface protein [Bacteroidales bacterium]
MKLKFLFMLMLLLPMSSMAQKVAYAVFKDSTLTFYYNDKKPKGAYDVEKMVKGKYDEDVKEWSYVGEQIKTVVFDQSFKEYRPKNCGYWFDGCKNLTSIKGIKENLNTSEVTDMRFMFEDCIYLTSLDVSSFKTDNVIDMCYMFSGCSSLTTIDLSKFNTENVTDMCGMFWLCRNLTSLDASGFNTKNVSNMYCMFSGCEKLTSLDVSGFKTDRVTNMGAMFQECKNLSTIDVSSFNIKNVTDMQRMFRGCENLETIYVGDGWNTNSDVVLEETDETSEVIEYWNTNSTIYAPEMFDYCPNLVGGKGTKFNKSHTGAEGAHIDGGESNPGYLTKKTK